MNPTPALRAASRAGELTYNPILDTHLNQLGSRIVSETLADAFRTRRPAIAGRREPRAEPVSPASAPTPTPGPGSMP